jgi:hypothetical protein
MKYLKVFDNFNYDNLKEEVEDLAEQSLAYLLDDGWEIKTNLYKNYSSKVIYLSIEAPQVDGYYGGYYGISFEEVEDRIIPFFQLLERRYKLEDQSNNKSNRPYIIYDEYNNRIDYSLKYLCSDTRQDFLIRKISIAVESKL